MAKRKSKTKAAAAEGSTKLRSVGGREHDISAYDRVKLENGRVSFDNGDDTAHKLRNKSLAEVYEMAAKASGVSERSLKEKYKALNPGMQRMALGNRIRAASRAKTEKAEKKAA